MHTNPETLALLALGESAGTPEERAHAATCPECSAEVAELSRLVDLGRTVTPDDTLSAPSPAVWEGIRQQLGLTVTGEEATGEEAAGSSATSSSPVVVDLASHPASASGAPARTGPVRRWLSLAVAAALALIIGIGVGLGWDRLGGDDEDEVVATADLTPGGRQWDGATGEARLEVDSEGHRFLVVSVSTPRPTNEQQVWVISDTDQAEMKNLGPLYENGQRFRVDGIDLDRFPLVDISDEPDANPAHSGNTIVRGPLRS